MGYGGKLISYILLLIFFVPAAWAADVYIDPLWEGTESGTFSEPFDSWTDVSWSANDDYRQKCGTTYPAAISAITVSGTALNYVLLGAYYDNGGSPVHEDDSPTFGQFCGNAAEKPKVESPDAGQPTTFSGDLITTPEGGDTYIEINSLQLEDAFHAIRIRSNYNIVRYCYLYNLWWGIRAGLASGSENGDYNLIEYNYIDMNDAVDEDSPTELGWDAINLGRRADNCTVQYNKFTGTDHGGIDVAGGDDNVVQYNYGFETNGHEDYCIGVNVGGLRNIIRFNFCDDHGMGYSSLGMSDSEIYGNVFTCATTGAEPYQYQGCFMFLPYGSNDMNDNKIYNNLIYDHDKNQDRYGMVYITALTDPPGQARQHTGEFQGNLFYNNIIQKVGDYAIRVLDETDTIGTNYFYNNAFYDFGRGEVTPANYLATIEGDTYTSGQIDTHFNARSDCSGNIVDDPEMKDPASNEFWADEESDNLVGAGCDPTDSVTPSACYDAGYTPNENLLSPNITDFTIPIVSLGSQRDAWYIGAYALLGLDVIYNSILFNSIVINQ